MPVGSSRSEASGAPGAGFISQNKEAEEIQCCVIPHVLRSLDHLSAFLSPSRVFLCLFVELCTVREFSVVRGRAWEEWTTSTLTGTGSHYYLLRGSNCPNLALGETPQATSCILICPPYSLSNSLLSGARCSKVILYFTYCSYRISHFSKEPCIL